jgi:hypothetical protein
MAGMAVLGVVGAVAMQRNSRLRQMS